MDRKLLMFLMILVVALIGVSAAYAAEQNNDTNKTSFYIPSQSPISLSKLVNDVTVNPSFKTYDPSTLTWLKGLDSGYVVYMNDDYYIIMNSTYSNGLTSNDTTGVSFFNNITAHVVENHTFGESLKNIVLVDDVEVVSQDLNSTFN